MMRVILASAIALNVCACSTVMEFNRPDPVDLSQFHPGQHRIDVVKILAAPLATVKDGPKTCDIYHLYTRGPNGAGKAGIALLEGVADVFTLGLTEVVLTPAEALTKNSLHPVSICYSSDETLLSVEETDAPVNASSAPTPPASVGGTTNSVPPASPGK